MQAVPDSWIVWKTWRKSDRKHGTAGKETSGGTGIVEAVILLVEILLIVQIIVVIQLD